jgi:hypothetical protein
VAQSAGQGRALLPNLDAIVLERSWAGEVLPHLDHTALGANPIFKERVSASIARQMSGGHSPPLRRRMYAPRSGY